MVSRRQTARLRSDAFREGADPPNRRAFFIIDADGTGLRQLTPWSLNAGGRPDWSPDGKLILFNHLDLRTATTATSDTIHPDGTGLKKLTNYPAPKTVLNGSFSPDGAGHARQVQRDATSGDSTLRANGTGVHCVGRDSAQHELRLGPPRR